MTVIYDIEGFDNCSTIALWQKKRTPAATSTLGLGTGRVHGQCLTAGNNNGVPGSWMNVPSLTTVVLGVAYKTSGFGTNTDYIRLAAGSTATCRFSIDASNHFQIRNSGGTVIASGTTVFALNTWYYVEIKLFVNGASGTVEVHINGTTEIASTTGNFGSTAIDNVWFAGGGAAGTHNWDDCYVADSFLGDCEVYTSYPDGAGNQTQWTPDSGSNYARVNEHSGTFPDDDTSYVKDNNVGDRDLYTVDDLPISTGSVFAVAVNHYARKEDAGARTICASVRQGGTTYDNSTTYGLGLTYAFARTLYSVNDPTGNPWTISNVNADEFGMKVVT